MDKTKESELSKQVQTLADKLPNFYDNRSQESIKVKKLLKKYNVLMFTFPTENVIRPELQVGCWVYRGINEIRDYLNSIKKQPDYKQ